MKNLKFLLGITLICFCVFNGNSFVYAQASEKTDTSISIEIKELKPIIESRTALYSNYLFEGDSVSIAAMYAEHGSMGCSKGNEILSSAGNWIRNNIKNDSRYVTFNTDTLNADGELLIETGTAEGRNQEGELKYSFRYLVIWRHENDNWKLYRDIGL